MLSPATGPARPAARLLLTSQLVHTCTVTADLQGLSAVPLLGCDEPDSAVAVGVVVPLDEHRDPQTGFLPADKGPAGIVRSVLQGLLK